MFKKRKEILDSDTTVINATIFLINCMRPMVNIILHFIS